jgi:xanthine/uracil permease
VTPTRIKEFGEMRCCSVMYGISVGRVMMWCMLSMYTSGIAWSSWAKGWHVYQFR